MKDFNTKRFFIAVVAVFIVKQVLDIAIHGNLLAAQYDQMKGIWRPNMQDLMWILWVTSIVFSLLFVYIFHFFRKGHFKDGIVAGLCFGFLVGLMMEGGGMFNQYALYNISASMIWQWFFYGMLQMIIYGLVVGWIYTGKEL